MKLPPKLVEKLTAYAIAARVPEKEIPTVLTQAIAAARAVERVEDYDLTKYEDEWPAFVRAIVGGVVADLQKTRRTRGS